MIPRFRKRTIMVAALAFPILVLPALNGCSERDPAGLEKAVGLDDPLVFLDEFSSGLDYAAFENSFYDAFEIDEVVTYADTDASLKFAIPAEAWAGGMFYSRGARNLNKYNALVFYAKASRDVTVGGAGFGLAIEPYPSEYRGEVTDITLTTDWTRIVLPLPNPARMTAEFGLFWVAVAAGDTPVDVWFDEVQFMDVSTVLYPRPAMSGGTAQALVGEEFAFSGTRTTFSVNGVDRTVYHTQNHFDYFSSDAAVARADANVVTAVGLGEATITARLGSTAVQGEVTAKVVETITYPNVFIDGLDPGLDYGSFGDGQYLEAFSIDGVGGVNGSAAIKITIPAGRFAGGAIFSAVGGRDLTSFDALVFDARSDQASYDLAEVGYGIGMAFGGTEYQAAITGVELTTDWREVIVPLPDPARLTDEPGVFYYSTGQTGIIWMDNVRFVDLESGVLTNVRPVMGSAVVTLDIGGTAAITGAGTTFAVDGVDVGVQHKANYFGFASSDSTVAVAADGVVTAVGGGTATITATLGDVDVDGTVSVTVTAPPTPPSIPAPTPPHAPVDVISIYSDEYDDVTVDTWVATWSNPRTILAEDVQIEGDNVKAYSGFRNPASYCGIEFTNDLIDATTAGMTHFHIDVYVSSGTQFGVRLTDFGPNGIYGGGDDTFAEVEFNGGSTPPFVAGEWVSLDIPLTELAGMNFGAVAQLNLQRTDATSLWIDNIYFHR